MPLPSMKKAKRCTAKAKSTQTRCCNPAKGDGHVCRLHGWRSPERTVSGEAHGQWRHGQDTRAARAASREDGMLLKQVKAALKKTGDH
jgi:hypothetical protein